MVKLRVEVAMLLYLKLLKSTYVAFLDFIGRQLTLSVAFFDLVIVQIVDLRLLNRSDQRVPDLEVGPRDQRVQCFFCLLTNFVDSKAVDGKHVIARLMSLEFLFFGERHLYTILDTTEGPVIYFI